MIQPTLDDWEDFSGDYLKAEDVKFPFQVVPVQLEAEFDEKNRARLTIVFELKGRHRKIELNKTNQTFVKKGNVMPKELVGKKLTFEKTMVRNPSSGEQVPSFLMNRIG